MAQPRLLFFIECGPYVPSGRRRVLDYLPMLERDGFRCDVVSLSSPALYRFRHLSDLRPWTLPFRRAVFALDRLHRAWSLLRVLVLAAARDVVFIQWLTPPAFWVALLRRINKRIVFDFDDAIFLHRPERTRALIEAAAVVTVGSHFIRDYAAEVNPEVVLLPTPVALHDFEAKRHDPAPGNKAVTIGWIGSPATLQYLEVLKEPAALLARRYAGRVRLVVVGGLDQAEKARPWLDGLELELVPYVQPQRIPAVAASLDIGIMPLFDRIWEKGKCAGKALEYMAAAVPTVASGVGENVHVIEDGVNGYLADTPEQWVEKLGRLIDDPALRARLGGKGRETIAERYSTAACYVILRRALDRALELSGKK